MFTRATKIFVSVLAFVVATACGTNDEKPPAGAAVVEGPFDMADRAIAHFGRARESQDRTETHLVCPGRNDYEHLLQERDPVVLSRRGTNLYLRLDGRELVAFFDEGDGRKAVTEAAFEHEGVETLPGALRNHRVEVTKVSYPGGGCDEGKTSFMRIRFCVEKQGKYACDRQNAHQGDVHAEF